MGAKTAVVYTSSDQISFVFPRVETLAKETKQPCSMMRTDIEYTSELINLCAA
jgi:hypothetical protein